MISQLAQTAICNRHHSIFEQLCRWLLLTLDRLSKNEVTMTQEFIINVLDRAALEQVACECYESVRSETEKILRYVPQRRVFLEAPVPVVEIPKSPEGAPRGSIARANSS